VPELPLAQKKLREARFFCDRLRPSRGEEFDYYLSAFLSAARSTAFRVCFALGSWDAVDKWKATRNAADVAFFDGMTTLRNAEIHNEGVPISTTQEAIAMPLPDAASNPAIYAALFQLGYFSSVKTYIDRRYVDLEKEHVEAVPACERLVSLLEDLLGYVTKL